jgi:hypothetical protein
VLQVWIQSPRRKPTREMRRFEGFFIEYPDENRKPAPMGMVSQVEDDPPLLNWIYINQDTCEVRHGNRTASRPHWVGNWSPASQEEDEPGEDEDPGGVALEGDEKFVAVEPVKGDKEGRWEVMWDEDEDGLRGLDGVRGRRVLHISLEREFVEGSVNDLA